MSTPITGDDLVRTARGYLGTPFHHAGRQKGLGVDCVGLVLCALHELGATDWDDRHYSRLVDPDHLRRQIERHCDPVPVEARQPGDLLLFRVQGVAQHVGLFTGESVIHAYETVGYVVEHRFGAAWERRLAAVYRWRGMA